MASVWSIMTRMAKSFLRSGTMLEITERSVNSRLKFSLLMILSIWSAGKNWAGSFGSADHAQSLMAFLICALRFCGSVRPPESALWSTSDRTMLLTELRGKHGDVGEPTEEVESARE